MNPEASCVLCRETGGTVIWHNESMRVVAVDEPRLPGYTRVIWEGHVKEMSELPAVDRHAVMGIVFLVEQAQRQVLQPDKVNLASLGNQTPHLHWHIMPRWEGDPWFPDSIWAPLQARDEAQRQAWEGRRQPIAALLDDYASVLRSLLASHETSALKQVS